MEMPVLSGIFFLLLGSIDFFVQQRAGPAEFTGSNASEFNTISSLSSEVKILTTSAQFLESSIDTFVGVNT